MIICVYYRQTCFPDPDMEEMLYSSTNISFECFSRDCTRLKDHGAGKLDLEPVIKAMLEEGIIQKKGEITCTLADATCKNKLFFEIILKKKMTALRLWYPPFAFRQPGRKQAATHEDENTFFSHSDSFSK